MPSNAPSVVAGITTQILVLRCQRVVLDADLANLYGVATKVLNQAVRRNRRRFPKDFMFRLIPEEVAWLNRSQSVTGSQKHRDPRFPPYAFTELRRIFAHSSRNVHADRPSPPFN